MSAATLVYLDIVAAGYSVAVTSEGLARLIRRRHSRRVRRFSPNGESLLVHGDSIRP